MEMKDKLRKLRQDRGMTQAQLAETLFVSRSTVAKWESGLGLPSQECMEMLERLYGISSAEVTTVDPETVIVEKNRRLHRIASIGVYFIVLVLVTISLMITYGLLQGGYGFTSAMAADAEPEEPYFQAGKCRIYYAPTMTIKEQDGSEWEYISDSAIVQQHFWGWTTAENGKSYSTRVITKDNYVVGVILTFHDRSGYYHLIKPRISNGMDTGLLRLTAIRIGSETYEPEKGIFFSTKEDISGFFADDIFYEIEP